MFINACSPPEAKIPLAESCTMSSLYSGIFNIISYQYHFTPISYDDHVFTPFSDLLSVITDYVIILHSSWKCVLVGISILGLFIVTLVITEHQCYRLYCIVLDWIASLDTADCHDSQIYSMWHFAVTLINLVRFSCHMRWTMKSEIKPRITVSAEPKHKMCCMSSRVFSPCFSFYTF